MSDSKGGGLWSGLSITRATKSPRSSEPLAHPLLGASTSSLNLNTEPTTLNAPDGSAAPAPSAANPTFSPKASATWSKSGNESFANALPYKPRQRGHGHQNSAGSAVSIVSPNLAPSSSTAGMTASAAPPTTSTFALPPSAMEAAGSGSATAADLVAGPSSGSASATGRLQLQSLKASAQRLGLGNGSMGMAMIDGIYEKGAVTKGKAGEGGDWGDLLRVLVTGKAVLLLPTTPSSTLPMTPQTLRDHIAFTSPLISMSGHPAGKLSSDALSEKGKEPAGTASTMVVTLSGLVGQLKGNEVTFTSMLESRSSILVALRDPASRSTSLASLRPVPDTASFPSYSLSSESVLLAFPALGKGQAGPPDPTANRGRVVSTSKLGRMNPFASLFGSPTAPSEDKVPDRPLSPVGDVARASSPGPSLLSVDAPDTASVNSEISNRDEGFQVPAYTIGKPIRSGEVHKALSKALRGHISSELAKLPEKVVERVIKLVVPAICPSNGAEFIKSALPADEDVELDFSHPQQTGDQLQAFMEEIFDELVKHYRSDSSVYVAGGTVKRKTSGNKPWSRASLNSSATESEETSQAQREERRRQKEELCEKLGTEGTERVEAAVTQLLYNRLFSPIESDDGRHDEALASRIAALNMLDLSLDHLGLITRPEDEAVPGTIANGLERIVGAIGTELQKLSMPQCMTPKQKADILIEAHKLVVDGLAKLPPVQLRPEGEAYEATTGGPSRDADSIEGSDSNLPPAQAGSPERTPQAFVTKQQPVPQLTLNQSGDEPTQLEEAMSDSVLTVHDTSPAEPPSKAGTSGADLILPIIIFAVVKANPPQLASQLMYLRRYRSAICLTGEASYAMVNLTAVVEFLEHVDLAELGLGGESDKVMSIADLSPIGLHYFDESSTDAQSIASASSRLRGRVFQVGEMAGNAAGSANQLITGVIDSSWSAVRGLITPAAGETQVERPALQRRQPSTFSLANVTASVASIAAAAAASTAAARSRANSRAVQPEPPQYTWQGNQEMIDVSRPQSIRENDAEYPSSSESDASEAEEEDSKTNRKTTADRNRAVSDTRSIRSVSSMMSKEGRKEEARMERVSLSDRLANIGGFGRNAGASTSASIAGSGGVVAGSTGSAEGSPRAPSPEKPDPKSAGFLSNLTAARSIAVTGHGRRGSLLGSATDTIVNRLRSDSNPIHPSSLNPSLPPVQPPLERYMNCDLGDIRLNEIGELLRDYRRLGAFINAYNASQTGLHQTTSNTT